mmetsp:Transcript_2083/g.5150  ORF Transcript_2083/g.5150 Transcript_2083/m.5150 type:complete len:487 (-) Transcript_2083:85-1545(-)
MNSRNNQNHNQPPHVPPRNSGVLLRQQSSRSVIDHPLQVGSGGIVPSSAPSSASSSSYAVKSMMKMVDSPSPMSMASACLSPISLASVSASRAAPSARSILPSALPPLPLSTSSSHHSSASASALPTPVTTRVLGRQLLPADFAPNDDSVVCGRGKICSNAEGNSRLKHIVKDFLPQYAAAKSKVEKTAIVSSIVAVVRRNQPADSKAAFVKKEDGRWWAVEEGVAREKVGCILRDCLHTRYRSSTKSKLARRRMRKAMNIGGSGSSNHGSSDAMNSISNDSMMVRMSYSAPNFASMSSSLSSPSSFSCNGRSTGNATFNDTRSPWMFQQHPQGELQQHQQRRQRPQQQGMQMPRSTSFRTGQQSRPTRSISHDGSTTNNAAFLRAVSCHSSTTTINGNYYDNMRNNGRLRNEFCSSSSNNNNNINSSTTMISSSSHHSNNDSFHTSYLQSSNNDSKNQIFDALEEACEIMEFGCDLPEDISDIFD